MTIRRNTYRTRTRTRTRMARTCTLFILYSETGQEHSETVTRQHCTRREHQNVVSSILIANESHYVFTRVSPALCTLYSACWLHTFAPIRCLRSLHFFFAQRCRFVSWIVYMIQFCVSNCFNPLIIFRIIFDTLLHTKAIRRWFGTWCDGLLYFCLFAYTSLPCNNTIFRMAFDSIQPKTHWTNVQAQALLTDRISALQKLVRFSSVFGSPFQAVCSFLFFFSMYNFFCSTAVK